jgi:hypothetical protein
MVLEREKNMLSTGHGGGINVAPPRIGKAVPRRQPGTPGRGRMLSLQDLRRFHSCFIVPLKNALCQAGELRYFSRVRAAAFSFQREKRKLRTKLCVPFSSA